MDNINELLKNREQYLDYDLKHKHWNKLKGKETEGGKMVTVIWKSLGKDYPDKGYLFELPFCAADEGDVFCHFPKTQNPDGKDDGEPIWIHMYDLMVNKDVVSITVE